MQMKRISIKNLFTSHFNINHNVTKQCELFVGVVAEAILNFSEFLNSMKKYSEHFTRQKNGNYTSS